MGVVWSSPYRWQLLAVCFGLFVLTTGLVFLLLSIGLEDDLWRLMGGLCASMGSALAVTGTCWCVWVVRHGRYGDRLAINIPDCEAETLTGDTAQWHDNMASAREINSHHQKGGFYDDIDDMETDEDVDYDDDEEDEEEEEEEEEEEYEEDCESEVAQTDPTEKVPVGNKPTDVTAIGQEVRGQRSRDQGQGQEGERTILKDSAHERLIPV